MSRLLKIMPQFSRYICVRYEYVIKSAFFYRWYVRWEKTRLLLFSSGGIWKAFIQIEKYRLDSKFMFLVTFHEFLNSSLLDREQYANKKDLKCSALLDDLC